MIAKDTTFTLKEISEASGIALKTLSARATQLRKKGLLPRCAKRSTPFFNYDQAVKLVAKPKQIVVKLRPSHVALLMRQLKNDGYQINDKPMMKEES